jgi:hypothetical protein
MLRVKLNFIPRWPSIILLHGRYDNQPAFFVGDWQASAGIQVVFTHLHPSRIAMISVDSWQLHRVDIQQAKENPDDGRWTPWLYAMAYIMYAMTANQAKAPRHSPPSLLLPAERRTYLNLKGRRHCLCAWKRSDYAFTFTLKSITCLFVILKLSTWFLFTLKLSTWFFFFFFILVTLKLSTLAHGNELRNN